MTLEEGRLTVAGPARPDLLEATAGVLALGRVSVRAATVRDGDGALVLLVLEVSPARDVLPSAERIEQDLARALAGDLDIAAGLADQERGRPRRRPTAAHVGSEVVVRIDHQASEAATLLEVRAPDRPGTLWRVAGALARAGVSVSAAIVATLGAEVVDAFYLRAADGSRLPPGDPHLERATRDVIDALTGDGVFTNW